MRFSRSATRLAVWLAVASALLGSSVFAQSSTTTGLMVNVHLTSVAFGRADDDTSEAGGGAGGRLGWGITKNVTLYVGGDYARVGTEEPGLDGHYRLTQGDAGVIYNFRAGKSFLPYLEAAATTQLVASTYSDTTFGPPVSVRKLDITSHGVAITFGTGFNYFFNQSWALNFGLLYSTGRIEDFSVDGTRVADSGFSSSAARVQFGLTLYPMK